MYLEHQANQGVGYIKPLKIETSPRFLKGRCDEIRGTGNTECDYSSRSHNTLKL